MHRLTLLVILLTFISALSAEEIHLKDGTKINGKIVAVKDDGFQIKTSYGEISVPRSQIVSINFPENQSKSDDVDTGPLAVDESLTANVYANRTGGFKMTVPPGWKIAPELRGSKDIVAALASADETVFLLVTPEKFAGPVATYKVLAETQYKSKFSDYQKLSETPAEIDGKSGLRLTFRGTSSANNAALRFMVYIIPYEGRMVRLTFFTLEPLFEQATPVFEKIAPSYHTTEGSH